MDSSLLVGETVIYFDGIINKRGLVMGTEIVRAKSTDIYPTTGYLILTDQDGKLDHIAYWRVQSIVNPDPAYLDLLAKKGNEFQVDFPKYEKKPHPKGWEVDQTTNDDLPL